MTFYLFANKISKKDIKWKWKYLTWRRENNNWRNSKHKLCQFCGEKANFVLQNLFLLSAESQNHISDTRCQFHQHFTRAFFVRKQIAQLSLVAFQLCNFWPQNFVWKTHIKRCWNWLQESEYWWPPFLLYLIWWLLQYYVFKDSEYSRVNGVKQD